jgi:two-component system, LytTR family, sensor kinase
MLFIIKGYYSPAGIRAYYQVGFFYPTYFLNHNLEIYTIAFIFGFMKIFKQWYISQQNAIKLQKEKTEAELKFLKSQLNPHFLFNVLNNLYALALKKSDQTPEMILHLSSIMDFILYETYNEEIDLNKELKLIDDYVELEKLRYGERLQFRIKVEGDPSRVSVAPLLVFPFVENCFKHGVSTDLENPFISILISAQPDKLELITENSKGNGVTQNNDAYQSGIGMKNVIRRLEISYPDKYKLEINDIPGRYTVHLTMNLSKT